MSDSEYQTGKIDCDPIRRNLMKYTRLAFSMIPGNENASILDIGCGSGVQTMELSRLGLGHITAIDIDSRELEKLKEKVRVEKLEHRFTIRKMSIESLDFGSNTFDIVWAEGSIFVLGFQQSILAWRNLLSENGCIVLHDDKKDLDKKMNHISNSGYELLGLIILNNQVWQQEYYEPLEQHVNKISDDPTISKVYAHDLELIRKEIEMFRKEGSESAFFILQKQ